MTINQMLAKAEEIASLGCPFCGNPVYRLIINDKEGISFECRDESCPSRGARLPLDVARKFSLKKKYAEMHQRLFKIRNDLKRLWDEEWPNRNTIRSYKQGYLKKIGDTAAKCRDAYISVRDFRLFDRAGNKVLSHDNPMKVRIPTTGDVFEVYSINTRRKAKKALLIEWELAKRKLKEAVEELTVARNSVRAIMTDIRSLQTESDAILSDEGFVKARNMALKGFKKWKN